VERFNGRVSEVIAQTRFKSAQELETTLTNYLATYNHRIPALFRFVWNETVTSGGF